MTHKMKDARRAGNIFFMLFAAVAMVGAFGVGASNMLKGLVASMSDVTRKTVAEERMTSAARIAFQYQAENAALGGDCDADTPAGVAPLQFNFIEPIPTRDAGALPKPANGGLIPLDIGLNTTDPWGTQYGYCAWDFGDDQCADSVAPRRLLGSMDSTKTVVAVISAGRDRRFSSTCNAYPNTEAVTRGAGGDDIVMEFTYNDVRGMGGEDLWKVKDTDPDTATIEKNIEVGGGATFTDAINLMQKGLILPTDIEAGACTPAKEGQLQLDTTTSPYTLKMCQSSVWEAVGLGAAASSTPVSPEGYTPPVDGLLAWWLFDEPSGTTTVDLSSSGLDGTLLAPASFVGGRYGNSINFDSGGNVSPGASALLDNKIKTGCAWVDLTATSNGRWLWRKGDGASTGSHFRIYSGQGTGSTDNIEFKFNGAGGTINDFYDLETGWHFLCSTWDGGAPSSSVRVYVDGVDSTDVVSFTSTASGAAASDAAEILYIGGNSSGANNVNGLTDDVMFYDRVLKPYEIGNLYFGPLSGKGGPYDPSLIAYYKLDDGLGTTAVDSSGNGRDATMSGFSASTAWTSGISGGALNFDGTNDVLNVGSDAAFDNLKGTICLWAKANAGSGNKTLFAKGTETANPRLSIDQSTWQLIYSGNRSVGIGPTIPQPDRSNWNFYCAHLKKVSASVNRRSITAAADMISNDSSYDLTFGAGPGASNYFSGQIDEIQIYNRELSNEEIAVLGAFRTAMPKGGVLARDGTRIGGAVASATSVEPNGTVIANINKYTGKLSAQSASHSCFIKEDKSVWCMGSDADAQLGNGPVLIAEQQTPTRVPDNDAFVSIALGSNHTCGLKSDGSAWCWGRNTNGQVGTGVTGGIYDVPTAVVGGFRFTQLAASARTTCAINNNGLVYCWGSDSSGESGNGSDGASATPTTIFGTDKYVKISGGHDHFCGIKTSGSILCWGNGSSGQMGNNTTTANNQSPLILSEPGPWIDVSAGFNYTCGVKLDGTAWCWGQTTNGKLGNGVTSGDILTPQKVLDNGPWIQIASGVNVANTYTCGIKIDGSAWCWGTGANGRLGNNNTLNRSTPVRVLDPGPWVNISVGAQHACGMKTDASVWCWGIDFLGPLGNGPGGNMPIPGRVAYQPDAPLTYWDRDQSALTMAGSNNVAMNGKVIQYGERTIMSPENGLALSSGGITSLNQTVTATSDSSIPVVSGLIGYWPLDGESDSKTTGAPMAYDKIRNLAALLDGGPVYVPAINGNGLRFDGVDDAVRVTTGYQLFNDSIQSVCLWVQYEVQPVATTTLVSKWNTTTLGFRLYAGDGVNGDLGVFSDGAYTVHDAAIPVGEWHHVCGTWSGAGYAASTLKIYKDGVALTPTLTNDGTGVQGSDTANFLIFGGSGTDRFKGIMDDIMIFNRELTPAEVAKIYARTGSPGVELGIDTAVGASVGSAQMSWKSSAANYYILGKPYNSNSLLLKSAANQDWVHASSIPTMLEITSAGNVGVKATSLITNKLYVNGGLRLGDDTDECVPLRAGTLRYVGTGNVFEYCNGTAWVAL